MSKIRRMEQAGAVFSESLSSISDIEKRFTVTGTPTIVNSPYGKAMSFDGSTGLAMTSIKTLTGAYSIVFWAKVTAAGSNGIIGVKGDGGNNYLYLASGTRFRFRGSSTNIDFTTDTDFLNKFRLYAITTDGTDTSLYIDGSLSQTNSGEAVSFSYDNIGDPYTTVIPFNGDIKDILIFEQELTTTEISNMYYNKSFDYEKSVVSEWDMSTTNPKDVGWKELANDGTSTGTTIVNGYPNGSATSFNGSSDFINLGSDESIRNNLASSGFTFIALIKQLGSTSEILLGCTNSAGGNGYQLGVSANKINAQFANNARYSWAGSTNEIKSDTWTVVAYTYAGSTGAIKFYADGVELGTNVVGGPTSGTFDSADTVTFGTRDSGSGLFYSGLVDKSILINKTLTPIQIKDLTDKIKAGRR